VVEPERGVVDRLRFDADALDAGRGEPGKGRVDERASNALTTMLVARRDQRDPTGAVGLECA